jgi:2-keto-4-pentenoate hydratase/2-oxohepta-3-ene-1,7-dioic acid hydratase in catechol pathway
MHVATVDGRLSLVRDGRVTDVEKASDGLFGPDPQAVYERWAGFRDWAAGVTVEGGAELEPRLLGSPVPAPRQVFAVGLNYADHAAETGFALAETEPPIFTKFPSSVTGPFGTVALPPGGHTDWEVELVVVIGKAAHRIEPDEALDHVAGYTVGQDLSERTLQMASAPPQFSLGKSFPGFAPMGPWLVTLDEIADPLDLGLECLVNGETVQQARTSAQIFGVPDLLARLSRTVTLLPGDVVFTGTPAGVAMGRDPQPWLRPGDRLTSRIEGIGEMEQVFR